MNKHTPGPWQAPTWPACTNLQIGSDDYPFMHQVGFVDGQSAIAVAYGDGQCEAESNARLIAAAPELLEALRNLLAYADAYSDSMMVHGRGAEQLGNGADAVSVSGMARAAIAKATGDSY